MKKSLALVLALIMVLSSFSFVSAAPDFADVKGTKYEDAVARLELLNVLKGYPDGSFKPENTITRAEFAAVAVRAKGLAGVAEAAKGLPSGFSDVPAGHWAAGYVGVAGSTGIVNGIGGGLFAPNAPVKYEEAVTMLVRALGYEVSAQAKGGYPFGYLIVAKEIDLLDDVVGTMGVPATRGMVAMLTDNALEIPMMVQVGFGSDTKWVVSGSTEHGGKAMFLLDFMGFTAVEGRVTWYDSEDMLIELTNENDDLDWAEKELEVKEGFDFFAANMVTIKAWVDGDEVVAYTLLDTVKYDAIAVDGSKVKLVTEDKSYTSEIAPFVANFAKVIFDGSKVVEIVDYDLNGFIVVDKVDDGVIIDLNDDEFDLEDFTVVKDGKTISSEDLKKGDVVFYDESAELAVVYNKTVEGKIDRVYTNPKEGFRLGGKVYYLESEFGAFYVDGAKLETLDSDILEAMMDEGEEVKAFFDFNKKVVLIDGETGDVAKSTFYAVVTKDTNWWTSRSGIVWSLDVFTEMGEKVAYDITEKSIKEDLGYTITSESNTWVPVAKVGNLVEMTVDADGDVTDVTLLVNKYEAVAEEFDMDTTYVDGERLMASTVVFYDYKDNAPRKVIKLGDVDEEFFEVKAYVYGDDGRVKVLLAIETDAETKSEEQVGLVKNIRRRISGYLEITIEVAGVEKVYESEKTITTTQFTDIYSALNKKFVEINVNTVNDKLMLLEGETVYAMEVGRDARLEVGSKSTVSRTINVYESTQVLELLSTTVIYDKDFTKINLRDIADRDMIDVWYDNDATSRFVKYIWLYNVDVR